MNLRKVSFEAYYDRIDELTECLDGNSLPEGLVMVDSASLSMSLPDFEEYGSFLEGGLCHASFREDHLRHLYMVVSASLLVPQVV